MHHYSFHKDFHFLLVSFPSLHTYEKTLNFKVKFLVLINRGVRRNINVNAMPGATC